MAAPGEGVVAHCRAVVDDPDVDVDCLDRVLGTLNGVMGGLP